MNKYLKTRRPYMRKDERNPYGSRGGYIVNSRRRGRDRGYNVGMAYRNNGTERGGRHFNNNGGMRVDKTYDMGYKQYGEYGRPMEYEMYGYGIGGIHPYEDDYNYGRDYGYDMDEDEMEKEWKENLHEWEKDLKHYDKFNLSRDEIINLARQMEVSFNYYTEDDFITTYYMALSDYNNISNEPRVYLAIAKGFLEDKDSNLKGSDKLCAYYYEIVKGEM